MAEQPQTIVAPPPAADKPLGARNETNLQSAYGESPIYKGEITDDERKVEFEALALNGLVTDGLGMNSFQRDYDANNPPDLEDVETGGQGKPATPYVPNPSSPGPGSISPNDVPEFTGEIPDSAPEFGSGLGGTTSPSVTSENISAQKLGQYISGRSYQGSDGRG